MIPLAAAILILQCLKQNVTALKRYRFLLTWIEMTKEQKIKGQLGSFRAERKNKPVRRKDGKNSIAFSFRLSVFPVYLFSTILKLVLCFLPFAFCLTSCNSDYVQKPRGYFEIELPPKQYQLFDQPGFPYTFEYPVYGKTVKDSLFFEIGRAS